ncbi:MAG: hypothetical protein QM650_15810 [Microlunatus sp.]
MILTDFRILVLDTGRVWWRLLPQLLTVYLLGWLGSELAQRMAIEAGERNSWIGLAVFSFSFLAQLVAIVVMLQLVGRELGVRELIPAAELVDDDRDSSLTRLISITLLPFLGIYAVFGDVSQRAAQLAYEQLFRNGVVSDAPSVLGTLNQAAVEHPWWLLAGLGTIYVLRRGLDVLHERTGIRALGMTVALVETFFMLVVIMGGVRVWQTARLWLEDRAVTGWLESLWRSVLDALSVISIQLPELVTRFVGFLVGEVWPLVLEALVQPVIWLAVAALVFGTQVLSLAELWRKGEPYLAKVPGSTVFASHAERRRAKGKLPPPAGIGKAASELKEAFLGDIDDKYLPTFHSLRLVLRAGVVFLGAYVAVYSAIVMASNGLEMMIDHLFADRSIAFWYAYGTSLGLVPDVLFEPLRICLLAVAFRRCLELFWRRSHDRVEVFPAAGGPEEPVPAGDAS